MNKKVNKAFTLVELIVVITILAILGTIAFLSFQGYNKDSRDAVRITDIGNIKTSLEVFNTKVGSYPLPSSYTGITYSGGVVRNQGIFGEDPFKTLGDISKLPQDPLGNIYYTYSVTNSKGEYEIAAVYEGNISKKDKDITTKTYADGTLQGVIKVDGTYNGVYVMTNTGGINYTVFTPTIINGDMNVLDLPSIISGGKTVINGGKTLPDSYNNSNFKNEVTNIGIGANILISTGSIADLKAKNSSGTILRLEFLDNLQTILSGSTIENSYKDIINNPTNDTLALNIIDGKYKPNVVTSGLVASNPGGGGGGNTVYTDCEVGVDEITLSNGQTWSCKNLGATTVWDGISTGTNCNKSVNNCNSGNSWIGDYYQRGRNEPVTGVFITNTYNGSLTNGNVGNNDMYKGDSTYKDWWQDEVGITPTTRWSGTNPQGPCPSGWHIPTSQEFIDAHSLLGDNIVNTLRLPYSGYRLWKTQFTPDSDLGKYDGQGKGAYYWSSTPYADYYSYGLNFWTMDINYGVDGIINNVTLNRSSGYPIRCIKD